MRHSQAGAGGSWHMELRLRLQQYYIEVLSGVRYKTSGNTFGMELSLLRYSRNCL